MTPVVKHTILELVGGAVLIVGALALVVLFGLYLT
jgi:hypothetical protein